MQPSGGCEKRNTLIDDAAKAPKAKERTKYIEWFRGRGQRRSTPT